MNDLLTYYRWEPYAPKQYKRTSCSYALLRSVRTLNNLLLATIKQHKIHPSQLFSCQPSIPDNDNTIISITCTHLTTFTPHCFFITCLPEFNCGISFIFAEVMKFEPITAAGCTHPCHPMG